MAAAGLKLGVSGSYLIGVVFAVDGVSSEVGLDMFP